MITAIVIQTGKSSSGVVIAASEHPL
jgi:hypothetical protein